MARTILIQAWYRKLSLEQPLALDMGFDVAEMVRV